MNPRWTRLLAIAVAASVFCASSALTQITISEAAAIYSGAFTCAAKFRGSFLDLLTQACWQCPSTHPHRTPFPDVAAPNACERRAQTLYRRVSGPENPTGILQCRSGWFPHFDGKCYSCGSGYNRTADPNIASARACERVIPAAYSPATRTGVEGCPAGAFRNGLTAYCYACPPDFSRNAVIADDLTKVKACSRISTAVRDATVAKYERHKNDHPESRANLARAAAPARTTGAAAPVGPGPVARYPEDKSRQDQMVAILEDELKRKTGYVVVSWMRTAGLALIVGYTGTDGYAMTKVDTNYVCRKVSSGAFTAGVSVGAGASEEIGISKSALAPGRSETNGVQVAAGVVFDLQPRLALERDNR